MQENTGKYMKLLLFIPWPVTLNYHLPVSLHKNETAQGESTMAMPMYPENFLRKTAPPQLPVYTVRGCR